MLQDLQTSEVAPVDASAPLVALVLAAGAGERMGGRPKCLLALDGEPLILRQIAALRAVGVTNIHVVLGHHAGRIAPVLSNQPVCLAHNPTPADGQFSSLHVGLQSLPTDCQTVLVLLADQPLIGLAELQEALTAYATRPTGTQWARPMVDGMPGHPVVFSAQVALAMRTLSPGTSGAHWARQHPDLVHHWATTNHNHRIDLDTPHDVAAFMRHTGRRLTWPADLQRPTDAELPVV